MPYAILHPYSFDVLADQVLNIAHIFGEEFNLYNLFFSNCQTFVRRFRDRIECACHERLPMPASSAGDLADLVKIGALLFLAIFPEFGYWLLSTTTWVTCRIAVFLFALWHEYETKRIRARELDGDRLWRAKAQLSYGRLEIEPRTEEIGGGRARTPHGMEKAMADFELALDDAVRNSQPRRIHSNYSTVNVLMLSWEGEDGESEIFQGAQSLKSVFEDHYNYSVSTWEIPHDLSALALDIRLTKLCYEHDAADNLFIIYFAGHRFPENNNRWYESLLNRGCLT